MDDITDLLEPDEEILWKKVLPPKNLLRYQSSGKWLFSIFFIIFIPLTILTIIGLIFSFWEETWYQWNLAINLGICIFPLFIFMEYNDARRIYKHLSKYYSDDFLRVFTSFYVITNKNIIIRWITDRAYKIPEKDSDNIKLYLKFVNDLIFLNHKYLRKIHIEKPSKLYSIHLYFNRSEKKKPEFVVDRIDGNELSKFLQTIQSLIDNLEII